VEAVFSWKVSFQWEGPSTGNNQPREPNTLWWCLKAAQGRTRRGGGEGTTVGRSTNAPFRTDDSS